MRMVELRAPDRMLGERADGGEGKDERGCIDSRQGREGGNALHRCEPRGESVPVPGHAIVIRDPDVAIEAQDDDPVARFVHDDVRDALLCGVIDAV